jgi:Cytochrome c3
MKIRDFILPISIRSALVKVIAAAALTALPFSALAENQTVCLQCHGSQTGRGGAPVKPWRTSVHAENGISCNDCHGGDPKDAANAMSPARGFLGAPKEVDIPAFCGRCHVGIKADYLQSAHGKALGHGGPTCVTCHGSHDIKKASLDLINEKSCTRCHSFERAAKIRGAMQEVEGQIVVIDQNIQQYKKTGVNTEAFEKELFSTRNKYHSLFHEVDTAKVVADSGQIKGELNKINASLKLIESEQHNRKLIGAGVVGLCLLAALLFYLLRKTYDRRDNQ